ncbi:MAG: transposase [Candidatus Binatia bacterium]|nr:transposase [Candidatus Binatia bacterium]
MSRSGSQTRDDSQNSLETAAINGGVQGELDGQLRVEPSDLFRLTYRMIEDLQRVRLAHGNRMRQVLPLIPATIKPPRTYASWDAFFQESALRLEAEETRLLSLAKSLLKDNPVGTWLLSQKGIGPALGVSILGECWPLSRFASPRKLWAFAGLHVGEDGKAIRRKKGQKSNWNSRLKTRLYLAAVSFVKCGGPWRAVYDQRKAYEQEKLRAHVDRDSHKKAEPQPDSAGAQTQNESQREVEPCPEEAVAHTVAESQDGIERGPQDQGAQDKNDSHIRVEPLDDVEQGGAQGVTDSQPLDEPQPDSAGALVESDSQVVHEPRPEEAAAQNAIESQREPERGPQDQGAQENYDSQPKVEPLEDLEQGGALNGGDGLLSPEPSKLHIHMRALRYVEKQLLKELWVESRKETGAKRDGLQN